MHTCGRSITLGVNTCLHDASITAQGWPAMLARIEIRGTFFRDFDDTPFASMLCDSVDAKVSFEVIQNAGGRQAPTEV